MLKHGEFVVYTIYNSSEVVKCWGEEAYRNSLSSLYLYLCISCETLIFAFICSCNSVRSGIGKCSQSCVCILCDSVRYHP